MMCLQDSLAFVSQVDEVVPVVCELLGSKALTDVQEAINFFVSGFEAGVTSCLVGVRRMLSLVRSKETSVKAAVVDAYKRIYLCPKGANARCVVGCCQRCTVIYVALLIMFVSCSSSWVTKYVNYVTLH